MINLLRQKFSFGEQKTQVVVDENLSYDQKLVEFSKSENAVQRVLCVREFVEGCFCSGFYISAKVLLPVFKVLIVDSDSQVREECYEILSELAGYFLQADYDEGYSLVCKVLVSLALDGVSFDPRPLNRQDAGLAVIRLCSHLRSEEKHEYVVSPLLTKLRFASDEPQRVLLTELVGLLLSVVDESTRASSIVPTLLAMSEDSSAKVRAAVVVAIAESPSPTLLNQFILLCADPETIVANACIHVFPRILDNVDTGMDEQMSSLFGHIFSDSLLPRNGISKVGFVVPHCPSLADTYIDAVSRDQVNMLDLARAFPKIVEKFEDCDRLLPVFSRFHSSLNSEIRLIVADCLSLLFARKMDWDLFPHLLALLCDSELVVTRKIHSKLPQILPHLSIDQKSTLFKWILSKCMHSWRRRKIVADNMPTQIATFNNEAEYRALFWKRLIPIWMKLVRDSAISVQNSALEASRCFDFSLSEMEIFCCLFRAEFANSLLSNDRQIFLRFAPIASSNKALFERIFVQKLVQLAQDESVVVRTTWAMQIAPLATNLPLGLAAHSLLSDLDLEVVQIVSKINLVPIDELGILDPIATTFTTPTYSSIQEWLDSVNGPISP